MPLEALDEKEKYDFDVEELMRNAWHPCPLHLATVMPHARVHAVHLMPKFLRLKLYCIKMVQIEKT